MFLWLVEQDLCETILELLWGSTSLGRGSAFSNLKESFAVKEHLDVSVVTSLMEICLQSPGTLSVHIDVGQICCVPDDVFMIILTKHLRKKRCNTHRNS